MLNCIIGGCDSKQIHTYEPPLDGGEVPEHHEQFAVRSAYDLHEEDTGEHVPAADAPGL